MKIIRVLFFAALVFCDPTIAAAGDPLDLQIRYGHYYEYFYLR